MKKILAIIMVFAMLFAVSACNIKDVTKMASVGDESAEKGVFNFYLQQGMSAAISAAQAEGAQLSADSSAEEWNQVMIGEKTATQYAIDETKEAVKSALVLKAVAIKEGMTLTAEDEESIKTQRSQVIEQFGGRYNYEQYFTQAGFTLEDVTKVIENEVYAQKVITKYFGDGGENKGEIEVSDEEIKKFIADEYVMAKHILISNQPQVAESAEGEEVAEPTEDEKKKADEDAKAKAEEIIASLDGGADFDALMKANTADKNSETGEINGLNGYLFTKGEMVAEFEKEAFALKEGEYSKEPVGTTYGYHIVKRLALPTSGEEYDAAFEGAKSKLLSDKMEEMVNSWAEELQFKFNDKAISNVEIVK